MRVHAHKMTTNSRTIADGDSCELEEEQEGAIRTHHTEKPNDLINCNGFLFMKKVGTDPRNTTLECLFPRRLASQL